VDAAAVRVAVDNDQQPWIVKSDGSLLRMDRKSGAWYGVPVAPDLGSVDIAIGPMGERTAWRLSTEVASGGQMYLIPAGRSGLGLLSWNGSAWVPVKAGPQVADRCLTGYHFSIDASTNQG